ncbi:MAG: hydrogenase maturation protease [Terriglobales bacterium]
MARILIVGYGNPLRSDDGLGWRAAEELSRDLSLPETEVEVIARHQLTPELADKFRHADAIFFIDAARGGQPGELTCAPVIPEARTGSSHHGSPAEILTLVQQLYGRTPRAYVVSLCGECFDHGEALSAVVENGLPKLTALVARLAKQEAARPLSGRSHDI